jgi:hypothetical protein
MINPNMQGPVQREGKKVVAINLGVGRYDVRVKIGPSYTTLREEMGTKLQELGKGNPVLAAALTPILMKLGDMPEADKVARIAMAMLPPEVQKAYNEEDSADMPPAAKSIIDEQGQHIQAMGQSIDKATKVIQDLQDQLNQKNDTVKQEASSAMKEIQLAQEKLKSQADAISTNKQLLDKDKQIAQLELKLWQDEATKSVTEAAKSAAEESKSEDDAQENAALENLAQAIEKGQQAMAEALKQNTQTLAQLQSLTVDAIEDMADAVSAERDIVLRHDKNGRTIGAKSVVIMPEPNEMQ